MDSAPQRVAEELRQRIAAGEFALGQRLPGPDQLASEHEVTADVVRSALLLLSAAKVVRATPETDEWWVAV